MAPRLTVAAAGETATVDYTEPATDRPLLGYAPDDWPAAVQAIGLPEVGRQFLQPGRWTVDWATWKARGIKKLVLSCKPDVKLCAAGNTTEIGKVVALGNAALTNLPGVEIVLASWHEPEDDIQRGAWTDVEFRQHQLNIIRALPKNPLLKPGVITMAYSLTRTDRPITRYIDDAMIAAGLQVTALDHYADPSDQPLIEKHAAWAKSKGLELGFAELSVGYTLAPLANRDAKMDEFLRTFLPWAKTAGVSWLIWFDQWWVATEGTSAVDWRLRTLPASIATWNSAKG